MSLPELQQEKQKVQGWMDRATRQMQKIDQLIQRQPTAAPNTQNAPGTTMPGPSSNPIFGNPQQTPGAAGWMGNALGRGVKAPGRALNKAKDWLKNKGQEFSNEFHNAESGLPILTAAGASATMLVMSQQRQNDPLRPNPV